jgi:hypothetical protein
MSLSTNRTTFTFNHAGQVDEYGASVGNYATVQENFDSRAEENLTDINNIKTTLVSETADDSGAHNVKSAGIAGLLSGAAASIYAMLSALKGYIDTAAANFQLGTLLDGSVTDVKLSDTAGQIKDTVSTHLAETVSHSELVARTIYVDLTNGNDTTGTGAVGSPFKTITKALAGIKRIIQADITISVAAGTTTENVLVQGFMGYGTFKIIGSSTLSNTHNINSVSVEGCKCPIVVQGVNVQNTAYIGCIVNNSVNVLFDRMKIEQVTANYGIHYNSSNGKVTGCSISNRSDAIRVDALSQVQSVDNTGTSNTTVLVANGSVIRKYGTQPSGTTAELAIAGGQIL